MAQKAGAGLKETVGIMAPVWVRVGLPHSSPPPGGVQAGPVFGRVWFGLEPPPRHVQGWVRGYHGIFQNVFLPYVQFAARLQCGYTTDMYTISNERVTWIASRGAGR
jgi:hypothetical protein